MRYSSFKSVYVSKKQVWYKSLNTSGVTFSLFQYSNIRPLKWLNMWKYARVEIGCKDIFLRSHRGLIKVDISLRIGDIVT